MASGESRVRRLTRKQMIWAVGAALAEDRDSPWHDRLSTGKRDPRKVTLDHLQLAASAMFSTVLIRRIETRGESPIAYAKAYWRDISDFCAVAWAADMPAGAEGRDWSVDFSTRYRLGELVSILALAQLGHDIISSALDDALIRDPWRTIRCLVLKLSAVDWEKRSDNAWLPSPHGFASQKRLYELLRDLVYDDRSPLQRSPA